MRCYPLRALRCSHSLISSRNFRSVAISSVDRPPLTFTCRRSRSSVSSISRLHSGRVLNQYIRRNSAVVSSVTTTSVCIWSLSNAPLRIYKLPKPSCLLYNSRLSRDVYHSDKDEHGQDTQEHYCPEF